MSPPPSESSGTGPVGCTVRMLGLDDVQEWLPKNALAKDLFARVMRRLGDVGYEEDYFGL